MDYERLWAPWRLDYVTRDDAARDEDVVDEPCTYLDRADPACFLCRDVAQYGNPVAADRAHHVVHHGEHTVIVLNRYPYNNGHLLIAPRMHKAQLP